MGMIIPVAQYWVSAIWTKFARKEDWQKWADHIISKNDNVEYWIFDVSTAANGEEFLKAVSDRLYEEDLVHRRMNTQEAMLGYYYWMLKRNDLKIREFLKTAGDIGHEDPFHLILNRLEKKQPFGLLTDDEQETIDLICKLGFEIAQSQWHEIQNYQCNRMDRR